MNKVREFYGICKADAAVTGWLALLTSVFLLVTSLFIPPRGVIDGSVIAATGELFAFAALFRLPQIIMSIRDAHASVTLQHGGTSVTVSSKEEEEEAN